MSLKVGVNAPGDSSAFGTDALMDLGCRLTRMVIYPNLDHGPAIRANGNLGITTILVVAREGHGTDLSATTYDTAIVTKWAKFYAEKYGHLPNVTWQVANEMNHVGDSSWFLEPAQFSEMLSIWRKALGPDAHIITGGLADGQPNDANYLLQCDLAPADGVAIHAYGIRPYGTAEEWAGLPGNFADLQTLIEPMLQFNLPIYITEVGVTSNEWNDPAIAEYMEHFILEAETHPEIEAVVWFCADDATMVPQFGLIDTIGRKKPQYATLKKLAGGPRIVAPPIETGYQFQLGFAKVAAAHPVLVGAPLEDEMGFARGFSSQRTSHGFLEWCRTAESGEVMGFTDLRNGKRYIWDGVKLNEVIRP